MANAGFYIIIIVSSCILAIFLLYKEYKRPLKHWLVWRAVASLILVGCLALMAIPVKYQSKIKQSKNELVLITDGFDNDTIQNIRTSKYYTDPALRKQLQGEATFIPDLAYYLSENPSLQHIKIYGDGINEDDLNKLKGQTIALHPSKSNGIVQCNWTEKVIIEQDILLQGSYVNSTNQTVLLKLIGYGSNLDSVKVPANKTIVFSLKTTAKQKGKALLQLLALNQKDTLQQEPIPIQTFDRKPINVLMLNSAPSFESKFVKNWLFENGYAVASRIEISKAKYSTDFFNRKTANINQLQTSDLKNEDVLLIDQTAFENLKASERNSILSAVNQGLGLIILIEDAASDNQLLIKIGLQKIANEQKTLELTIDESSTKLHALPINQQVYISSRPNQQVLISNPKQKAIATQQLYGAGKIVVTTLADSYEWDLLGQQKDYASYWSTLISAASRKQSETITLKPLKYLPTVGQELTFQISTANTEIPEIKLEDHQLHVNQNLIFPNIWETQTWSAKPGWNTFKVNQSNFETYVFGKKDWKTVKAKRVRDLNREHINRQTQNPLIDEKTDNHQQKEISKWYFLVGLILAAGFLWFENKMY